MIDVRKKGNGYQYYFEVVKVNGKEIDIKIYNSF